MVPGIFGAVVFSGVVMAGGQPAGWAEWPRFAAALVAFGVALKTRGNLLVTVVSGMAAPHGLPWLTSLVK